MRRDDLLRVIRRLQEQPTAPFRETAVRDAIVAELQKCKNVRVTHDKYGNVIARYKYGRPQPARWAFAAHMDHPGWVRTKTGDWRFLGNVPESFLVNPRKREFGDLAMWDLPEFKVEGDQIYSRACDDLMGCAEIICSFRELEAKKANAHCLGIFTRAEEVGFWGAIQLARSRILPRSVVVLSLETSVPKGGAVIGKGPIVRVGDRLSIFDSVETARVIEVAAANDIPVQRCLLDGGSCEATAYQLYGYRSVAASIGLGNYHNCAGDGTIQCEHVSIEDYTNMVRLCVALACASRSKDPRVRLRSMLEKRVKDYRPFFRPL